MEPRKSVFYDVIRGLTITELTDKLQKLQIEMASTKQKIADEHYRRLKPGELPDDELAYTLDKIRRQLGKKMAMMSVALKEKHALISIDVIAKLTEENQRLKAELLKYEATVD